MNWFCGLEDICRADVPLRDHTWYRLGGPARWLCTPRDEPELIVLLARLRQTGVGWRMLGQGANLLVRDEGFEGAVIKLCGPIFERVRFEGSLIHAAAGADFPKLVKQSVERGLAGLEGLAGIPGTVGGLIKMNAGGRYGNIAEVVREVRLVDGDGQVAGRSGAEIGFSYRCTNLDGCIVLGATFALRPLDRDAILRRYRQICDEKCATQPGLGERSAGCIFKNPPGQHAGALIDRAGLKGRQCGAAEISTKHANFILARPGAKARDVLDLISLAKDRVRATAGIDLELEVEIW